MAHRMPTSVELGAVRERCQRVLAHNWREGRRASDGVGFAYTCPSPGRYPWQWYWDSCFTAISWRHFDRQRSRRELESLLAAQREDGFIGHTIFWNHPLTGRRRHTYNVTSPDAAMTASIQPPALAWAWQIAVGDPTAVAGIRRQHQWLEANRDLDGDGLLWIVQPDESGLDASNQFDPIWRRRAHGLPGFVRLVHRNRRLGYDLRRIADAGGPVCLEIVTNVLYILSRLALGLPSLTDALVARTFDERRGLFTSRSKTSSAGGDPGHDRVAHAACATRSAGGDRSPSCRAAPARSTALLAARAPPSVSAKETSFSPRDPRLIGRGRIWRGPTWINTAWLVWLGLRRLGYEQQAAELARRLAATVSGAGLWEYYEPFTGSGMGAVDFGWSTLVLEMLDPDPRAPRSYLA